MKTFLRLGAATALAVLASVAMAQANQDHSQHHPGGDAASAKSPAAAAPAPTAASDRMKAMEKQMADMKAMHEKFVAAKTPQERQSLMAEHMKVMRSGMELMSAGTAPSGDSSRMPQGMQGMQGMQGGMMGEMAQRHQMMEKRMEMMESMMRMMMDRVQ